MPGSLHSQGGVATAVAHETAAAYPGVADLLRTVHARMGADEATVLLLDPTRTLLEQVATIGLDRTLRGARRVPMGQGFAGRVAQTRQPLIVSDVSGSTVINPVLHAHGLRSLLGAPIIDGSELLGVLHVGFSTPHHFDEAEQRLLTEYAHELGVILRNKATDVDHTAALTLQRSLLPAAPTAPDGLVLSARYVPAEGELGGDWYDVFQLPGGRLGVVMGDVVGHGLDAAIVMGRLRSALRAYALDHEDPAEVLFRLDRKICHFEPDGLATVLFGVSSAPYEQWEFSSAGHFAPVVAAPGEAGVPVDLPIDRLLGLNTDSDRRTTTVKVPPGGFLCLFTDGLVERRPSPDDGDDDIIASNIERLGEALIGIDDPETGCIRALTHVVGDHVAEDDIAVLVAQRTS
jgi:phosphoserine phosphatase RsbU/P